MWLPLKLIMSADGKEIIINEDLVVSIQSVEGKEDLALVRMANGDEMIVSSPSYSQWENDEMKR